MTIFYKKCSHSELSRKNHADKMKNNNYSRKNAVLRVLQIERNLKNQAMYTTIHL